MKGRTTLALLGLLTLLAAYIYFFEIRSKARKEKAEEKAKKVLTIESKDIQKITVKRASDSFVCEKNKEEDWRLLSPVEDRADKSTMSSLVSSLSDMKIDRENTDIQQYSDYGLEPSLYTVVVGSVSGKIDTVFFGEKNPTGSYIYARKSSDRRVILTNSTIQTYLTKPIFDIRDKSVLPFEKEDVERVRVESFGNAIGFAKTGSEWNLTEPIKTKGDENTIDSFLNQFKWAQVKEYVEENSKSIDSYGLSHPQMVLTMILKADKSQKVLFIGKPKDKSLYYAKDSGRPPVFLVDSTLVREFKKTVLDFRDKKIFRFETDSVRFLTVEYPDKPSLICRKDTADNWFIKSPQKAKAIQYKINSMLYDLRDMQARDFLGERLSGLAAFGLDRPQVRVVLKNRAGANILDALVGKETGTDRVYVMNDKTKSVFKADNAFVKNMRPNINEIVEKEEAKESKEKNVDAESKEAERDNKKVKK